MTPEIDDETLMAYADGELEPAAAASVERALAADPRLAARVDLFRRTREAVALDARRAPAPPVPEALVARVRELAADAPATPAPNVLPFRAAPPAPRWQLPLAASIALAIGLGAGFLAGRDRVPVSGLQIAALADPAVGTALGIVRSGERTMLADGSEIEAIASFRGRDGELCREFEHGRTGRTVVAVACREAGGWNVRFAVATPAAPGTGYAPASSLETLDAYLTSTEAGQPLSPEEEAAALAGL